MQRGLSNESTKVRVMRLFLLVGLILAACTSSAKPSCPDKTWNKVKTPEALGWSAVKLKLAREYSLSIGSSAVLIVVNGEILDEWGDTTRKIDVRSIIKPFTNGRYSIAVQEGKINSQRTLAEL